MNPSMKTYCWSAAAGLATYVLGVIVMYFDIHPVTAKQILTVITFPLCLAVIVSSGINLKLMRPHMQKYYWRMVAGMGAYVLGICLANHIHTPPSPYKYLLILMPIVPLIYVCFTIIRCIADMDEMLRKINMEAMAFSGIATGFTCFTYLFFRDLGAPEFRAEWAFYIMWAYFMIGKVFSWRRYR
jgi:hypothetical protein